MIQCYEHKKDSYGIYFNIRSFFLSLDYSKSESDKRAYNKQSPSESSPQSDENEYRPENFMRRLSFDLSGDGLNKARRQTKKQENQSHHSLSGKQYCLVDMTHA